MSNSSGKKVYYARAMDGLTEESILRDSEIVAQRLYALTLDIIDPYIMIDRSDLSMVRSDISRQIVETDLALLRTADAVLMDLSISGRSYVGCICELVYSYTYEIPVVVNVGQTDLGSRHWLRYHSTSIVNNLDEALTLVHRLLLPNLRTTDR